MSGAELRAGGKRGAIVKSSSFGMHICGLTDHLPPPLTPFHGLGCGAFRLWDCGVNWRSIETSKGVFNWSRLDELIGIMVANGVSDIMYVLGQPPNWATSPATGSGTYNPNPPNDNQDWTDFITALLGRYPGVFTSIEVWNEPNYSTFYNGSIARLVELTILASAKIKEIDPSILVVSPCPDSYANRGSYLNEYLAALAAAGGIASVDVVSCHTYVQPREPEYSFLLMQILKRIAVANGFGGKPLWSTEIGWGEYYSAGTYYDTSAAPMPQSLAVAYVARMYLLSRAAGFERQYFYAMDKDFSKRLSQKELSDFSQL